MSSCGLTAGRYTVNQRFTMYKRNVIITNKNKWKFDSYLGYNRSWWNYYNDYI